MAITTRLGKGYTMTDLTFYWLVTHEIGHNWGGRHGFESPGVCAYGVMSYNQKLVIVIITFTGELLLHVVADYLHSTMHWRMLNVCLCIGIASVLFR